MNDLLKAASMGCVSNKKGYVINIPGIAKGIMELTEEEATLVEAVLNPDNWNTKNYLSDSHVTIINSEAPIEQIELQNSVEFFNRRYGLDSTEFDCVVRDEDYDDYTINKIFEKMRSLGLTRVSYDIIYRTLEFLPRDCYNKVLETSISLNGMGMKDLIYYWKAMGYIPNKPYIVVDKNNHPFLLINPGEYMYHSGGVWSFGYSINEILNEGDRNYISFDSIKHLTGARKDKNCEARLSSDIGLYLSWLSFAIRLVESKSMQVYLLFNNPRAMMTSWAKYLKYTTDIESIKVMDVNDIVDTVYNLSINSDYKVNFYAVRRDGRQDTDTKDVITYCKNILLTDYPEVW